MIISRIQSDGDDFIVEIPEWVVERDGLSENDVVEVQFSRPTEAEIAEYFEQHPELRDETP